MLLFPLILLNQVRYFVEMLRLRLNHNLLLAIYRLLQK